MWHTADEIWITKCFHSASYVAVFSESVLTPLPPLINFIQARYALRIVGTHPFSNPASARLPPSSPIHWDPKPPKRTFHFKHRFGAYTPKPWNSKSDNRILTHLPVDKVLSRLLPLTTLNPLMPRYYKAPLPPGIASPNLGLDGLTPNQANSFLLSYLTSEWTTLFPHASYKYPIPTKPHTFLRLGTCQA